MQHLVFALFLLSLEIVGRSYAVPRAHPKAEGTTDVAIQAAPPNQPGSAIANASPCPNAKSSWDSCGSGHAGITYVTTAQNWIRTVPLALTGGTQTEVTLTPCPIGGDTTSGAGYEVFISGSGNSEAASVVS